VQIFNTLGRALETFEPRDAGRVGMYVCGATVQSKPHLGHGRYAVVFDVVRRYFSYLGYDVTYVRNIFATAYDALGILPADIEPRATEHIPQMITMIEHLIEGGHAYEAGGDVYFSVRRFPGYGKLSGHKVDELQSGARVATGDIKRDPLDFAVWKAAKPGEPSWPSPWGNGRPGWHIECSAMSYEYLGASFDIHGGGNDLIFPHHENEIAQAEAALGVEPFARQWMHNGMMTLTGEKMSKSTGHIIDLLDAVEKYPGVAVRLFYLRTHYRKPLDFSEEALADATSSLGRLWTFRRRRSEPAEDQPDTTTMESFSRAMDNDFDVAGGLGALFDAVREGNRRLDAGDAAGPWLAAYDEIVGVLGLAEPVRGYDDIAAGLAALGVQHGIKGLSGSGLVDALVEHRSAARANKDWATGDTIRDGLAEFGVIVEDGADGSAWHRG
jgi:cysteinyl-tRNA synthetase